MKLTISVNKSSVNRVYNFGYHYVTLLKISHILAPRAHYNVKQSLPELGFRFLLTFSRGTGTIHEI